MVGAGQLDFAVNVVPGGPPGWLRRELHAAVDRAAAYPDERLAAEALACAALAAWAREGAAHARPLVGQVAAARERLAGALREVLSSIG